MAPVPALPRRKIPFSIQKLDRRAVQVVRELQKAGYEAYLVGGCVRDLLLLQHPKDYDIATSAKPEQVRRLFRRSRIIGRRFRLVHVHQGRDVYEVATFRRGPESSEVAPNKPMQGDNLFGTAEEDAMRRDFTVNALFLDPVTEEILDWAGGFQDLKARNLRSIGDPRIRFQEDPVRILRMIKFMRRLSLQPGKEELHAAREGVSQLSQAAAPRLVEEVFRLLLTGDSVGVLEDLVALDALRLVLPDLHAWASREALRLQKLQGRLQHLDAWVQEGDEPCYSLRLAILYGPFVEEEFNPATRTLDIKEKPQIVAHIFRQLQTRARLPRHALSRAARILLTQLRLDPPTWTRSQRRLRRKTMEQTVGLEWFEDSMHYLRARLLAEGHDLEPYDIWQERALSLRRGKR